jgi:ribosomal protein RSM22 (predicted rRNA methylase)
MSLPDVWYLCDDEDWVKLSALLYDAGQCLIELRLMSLDTKMENLLMEIRTAERQNLDLTDLANQYTSVSKQKSQLQTKPGRLHFIDNLLEKAYQTRQITREEVLPL